MIEILILLFGPLVWNVILLALIVDAFRWRCTDNEIRRIAASVAIVAAALAVLAHYAAHAGGTLYAGQFYYTFTVGIPALTLYGFAFGARVLWRFVPGWRRVTTPAMVGLFSAPLVSFVLGVSLDQWFHEMFAIQSVGFR